MAEIFGVMAEFDSAAKLLQAADKAKKAGYTRFETYSPFPIHGMDHAMGLSDSKMGWIALSGGLIGCATGTILQCWVAAVAYPLNISGKPMLSIPAFIPIIFEMTILFAAFAVVFGMFAVNGLPRLYHAIFNHSKFHTASSHGFFLSVDSKEPKFDSEKVTAFLEKLGGLHIEVVKEDR